MCKGPGVCPKYGMFSQLKESPMSLDAKAGREQTCKVLGTFKEVDLCLKSNSHCIMFFKCLLLVPCSYSLKSRIEMVDRRGLGQRPVYHLRAFPHRQTIPSLAPLGHDGPVAHTPA